MRVTFFLLMFCGLVNGECGFDPNDSKSKEIEDKMKKWNIYNKK